MKSRSVIRLDEMLIETAVMPGGSYSVENQTKPPVLAALYSQTKAAGVNRLLPRLAKTELSRPCFPPGQAMASRTSPDPEGSELRDIPLLLRHKHQRKMFNIARRPETLTNMHAGFWTFQCQHCNKSFVMRVERGQNVIDYARHLMCPFCHHIPDHVMSDEEAIFSWHHVTDFKPRS